MKTLTLTLLTLFSLPSFAIICGGQDIHIDYSDTSNVQAQISKADTLCNTADERDYFKKYLIDAAFYKFSKGSSSEIEKYFKATNDDHSIRVLNTKRKYSKASKEQILNGLNELAQYAPDMLLNKISALTENQALQAIEAVSRHQQGLKHDLLMIDLYIQHTYSPAIINYVLEKDIDFSSKRAQEAICESIYTFQEYFSEDVHIELSEGASDQIKQFIKDQVQEEIDIIKAILKGQNIRCDGQTLYMLQTNLSDPDYWNVDEMMPPEPVKAPKLQKLDSEEAVVSHKNVNFKIKLSINDSCKITEDLKNHLYSHLYNQFQGSISRYGTRQDIKYTNGFKLFGCELISEYQVFDTAGVSLDEYIDSIK
ncbi:MAG: hypothetical protein KC478_01875 [Bacteriovoracaceae bacterium]|nr:hypothetical protein [Bacteriovoracaceae bacterium]